VIYTHFPDLHRGIFHRIDIPYSGLLRVVGHIRQGCRGCGFYPGRYRGNTIRISVVFVTVRNLFHDTVMAQECQYLCRAESSHKFDFSILVKRSILDADG
jgi:hypothetical protein